MTDISERLREIAFDAKTDTSPAIWDYPEALTGAADHIDAQAATIKALVEALEEAIATIADYVDYEHDGDPWTEDARAMGEMDIDDYAKDGRLTNASAALAAAKFKSMALDCISAHGQAMDAYQEQIEAEAKLEKALEALRDVTDMLGGCVFETMRVRGQYLDRADVVSRSRTVIAELETT